jgi:hypothetical protein
MFRIGNDIEVKLNWPRQARPPGSPFEEVGVGKAAAPLFPPPPQLTNSSVPRACRGAISKSVIGNVMKGLKTGTLRDLSPRFLRL